MPGALFKAFLQLICHVADQLWVVHPSKATQHPFPMPPGLPNFPSVAVVLVQVAPELATTHPLHQPLLPLAPQG